MTDIREIAARVSGSGSAEFLGEVEISTGFEHLFEEVRVSLDACRVSRLKSGLVTCDGLLVVNWLKAEMQFL